MEKRTPNKRKSLANSNTPNKIRKTDTPVSQKVINKSPKSVNKNNQISSDGKKSKSPNKNQNVTLKKQVNGNQATPKKQMNAKQATPKKQMNGKQTTPKGNKKSKQEEEDDVELMDDSDKYDNDNSIDEMNDSDVEDAAMDEDDSDEDAQVDEDVSGDELQVDEEEEAESDDEEDEVESDEKAQVDEEESGDEVQDDEDESGDEVQDEEDEEAGTDEQENDDGELENDEEINKEDNDQGGTEIQNTNKIQGKWVLVFGLKPDIRMKRIFSDCNIKSCKRWRNPRAEEYIQNGVVHFKDQESLKKALAKQRINVNGNIIKVGGNRATMEFGVSVRGLKQRKDLWDIFNDCNILWVRYSAIERTLFIYFEDKESMQKALLKSGTEFNGKSISVLPTKEVEEKVRNLKVITQGFNSDAKIEDIFENCNINFYYFRTIGTFNGNVIFEDEESLQKALLMEETEYNGSVIKLCRKNCTVFVRGIKENTKIEEILTGCNILSVKLIFNKSTNELEGAAVYFKDYSSVEKALSLKTPPGITITVTKTDHNGVRNKFEGKSGFIKNKFNKTPYQQTHGNVAKKLLLQELKSQVQKLTEEVYGTSKPRPKPFMKNNTFARRNPRISN